MKAFFQDHKLMLFCLILIWIKTFIASSITFQLNINELLEIVRFAINPLAFLLIIFSVGIVLKSHIQPKYYFAVSVILTIILYSNAVYYREFSDVITLPMLVMSTNMGDLSTSIFELVKWYDILFFADIILIGYFTLKAPQHFNVRKTTFRQSKGKFAVIILAVLSIVGFSQVETTNTATHSFNREHIVNKIGLYNFYVYDAFVHALTSTQTVFADADDWGAIDAYLEGHKAPANNEMFGVAEDMNVIVVSLESFQDFVIGETIDGQEITPFLNDLIEDSFYFENFYYQTGQGKTSDAEFMINNSLYPLGRGAVFHTHDSNEYEALPELLQNKGYSTAAFHANDKTFYNRDVMYENLGYQRYYDIEEYEVTPENSSGWGLRDIEFFNQTMDHLSEMEEPFYGTFLTLTNHFPYELDEEHHYVDEYTSDSEVVNSYFPTVRYTDEAIKVFVEQLKAEGLYENTILVMYGDHYGIAENHNEAVGDFLGKEITAVENVKLKQVPLIIHIPGMEGETLHTVSGQIDVMPTLLNLLGVPSDNKVTFGNDLFSEERGDFAVLRDGTVITDELIYTGGNCYQANTGESVALDACSSISQRGKKELQYSDEIIYGDLFRFR